jgi:glycosyltransferase involved in cell wall biosynthesis
MVPTTVPGGDPGAAAASGQNQTVERVRRVAVTVEQCWHRVPGGTATAALATIAALHRRPDLHLVGVAARHRDLAPPAFRPSIEVAHLPLPRRVLYETWHALRWPPVERATGPVEVVHATAVAVPATRAPLVMTINDLAFLADPTQATRHGNRFFRRGTELARRHAALVLVPSEATAEECRRAGFDERRLRVVPYGVTAHPVSDADVAAARVRHGLDRPYVLFVGTVEPRKNLAAVVAGMRALDGRAVDLVLVGPDGWNEDLARRLAPLEATSVRVHRVGFLGAEELPALYAGAAAFCYPSLREGFGLPVLEAMAHGAPVVTSTGTATAEVAGPDALLVDPRDHRAVGEALESLLDDPAAADRLRSRGRVRAASYTWERTAGLVAEAYAEVAP